MTPKRPNTETSLDLRARFRDVVESEADLRSVLGHPAPLVLRKELAALDSNALQFIERSPFAIIATSDADGRLDASPKGDPAGFVRVLDEKTLAIPDRPGNRRADTFTNLIANDRIGLIFLIPGKQETLRVSGRAIIVRDIEVRSLLAVREKVPEFAIIVAIEQVFFHCAKCMIRSGLWAPESWAGGAGLATLAETLVAAGKPAESVEELQAAIDNDAATNLY
jgi:PPOX class probable FMN-dependent enzyme